MTMQTEYDRLMSVAALVRKVIQTNEIPNWRVVTVHAWAGAGYYRQLNKTCNTLTHNLPDAVCVVGR